MITLEATDFDLFREPEEMIELVIVRLRSGKPMTDQDRMNNAHSLRTALVRLGDQ